VRAPAVAQLQSLRLQWDCLLQGLHKRRPVRGAQHLRQGLVREEAERRRLQRRERVPVELLRARCVLQCCLYRRLHGVRSGGQHRSLYGSPQRYSGSTREVQDHCLSNLRKHGFMSGRRLRQLRHFLCVQGLGLLHHIFRNANVQVRRQRYVRDPAGQGMLSLHLWQRFLLVHLQGR
jgi:hypothetical protein